LKLAYQSPGNKSDCIKKNLLAGINENISVESNSNNNIFVSFLRDENVYLVALFSSIPDFPPATFPPANAIFCVKASAFQLHFQSSKEK